MKKTSTEVIHIPASPAHVGENRSRREPPSAAAERQARQRQWQRQEQHDHDEATGPLPVEQARDRFKKEFLEFMQMPGPVALAFDGDFGLGKTTIAAQEIGDDRTVIFVPTLRLADEIRRKHLPHARVFRGRDAEVPGDPTRKMCDDLPAVHDAYEAGLSVTDACCHRKTADGREQRCPFRDSCEYWKQKDDRIVIWIAVHQMLFLDQGIFTAPPKRVIIDEDFWQRGFDPPTKHGLRSGIAIHDIVDDNHRLQPARSRLAQALRRQELEFGGFGGVDRRCFDGLLSIEQCSEAISAEWRAIDAQAQQAQWPGMSVAERAAARWKRAQIMHDRQVVRIFEEVRDLLRLPEGTVSGRLRVEPGERHLMVVVDGLKPVLQRYSNAAVFMMSGTLPKWEILSKFFPHVETVARIRVKSPHMRVRQVTGAPVTMRKLWAARNRQMVHSYVLARWHECGRPLTVAISNLEFEKWLRQRLPDGIALEHYNNIRGTDIHKEVGLLDCIGRPLPGPERVEQMAGVLTGVKPREAKGKGSRGRRWYEERGVEIAEGVWITVDWHPDPTAEAVRAAICDAEILQAIGRGRGVNRTTAKPIQVEVMADVKLPIAVDEAVRWSPVNPLLMMLIEQGIMLLSPADLVRLRPKRWNLRMAERAIRDLCNHSKIPPKPSLILSSLWRDHTRRLRYQPSGVKQQWREAWYDPAMLPDPRAWLEKNLGAKVRVRRGGNHEETQSDVAGA